MGWLVCRRVYHAVDAWTFQMPFFSSLSFFPIPQMPSSSLCLQFDAVDCLWCACVCVCWDLRVRVCVCEENSHGHAFLCGSVDRSLCLRTHARFRFLQSDCSFSTVFCCCSRCVSCVLAFLFVPLGKESGVCVRVFFLLCLSVRFLVFCSNCVFLSFCLCLCLCLCVVLLSFLWWWVVMSCREICQSASQVHSLSLFASSSHFSGHLCFMSFSVSAFFFIFVLVRARVLCVSCRCGHDFSLALLSLTLFPAPRGARKIKCLL